MQVPVWEPPIAGSEIEHVVGMLERLRMTFRWKADGLDADALAFRLPSSALSLGGLLKHLAACEAFYRGTLGFTLSDYIQQDIQGMPIRVAFFHINPRHHTLGIAAVPAPKRLHHFMVQVADLDAVGRALDRARQAGLPIAMTLGKHPNDQMVSFYATTPSGFAVEIGTGGVEIRDEDTWQVRTYDALSEWGHGFGA